MKTVIVTGSNGLLGQKLTNLLANRPAVKLIATGTGKNRNPDTEGYTYETLDITNVKELKTIFEKYKPTALINSAALTNVDQCEKEPETSYKINVEAVKHMIDLCAEFDTHLIHLSTDFIFDGEAGPYKEADVPNPLSIYGTHKLQAEQLLKTSHVRWAIARTILLYGIVKDMSRSNIVLWAKSSLESGKKINVVDDQFRTPTLAEDLADGIAAILSGDRQGIYHLSGAELYSIIDIVYKVADHWGLDKSLISPIDSARLAQPAKRPPRTGFIILKAQTELDYKPHTLEAGLAILDRQLKDLK